MFFILNKAFLLSLKYALTLEVMKITMSTLHIILYLNHKNNLAKKLLIEMANL